MLKYAMKPNPKNSVKVYGSNLRISRKNSLAICRAISGRPLEKGKELLERMLEQKQRLKGKYYTNATSEILDLLNAAEKNAEFKGLEAKDMVVFASTHKGFTFYTPRRFRLRRRKKKVCNVQIVLLQK